MVELLLTDYWSRADAFLLPLTGLNVNQLFKTRSYMFWNEFSINDYKLIIEFEYGNDYENFLEYLRGHIFPVLDKNGYLVESYDFEGRSIFILDMSEWAMDIENVLAGKYSKLTREAKAMIQRYHIFEGGAIPIHVWAVLFPTTVNDLLEKKTPLKYISDNYDMNYDDLIEIGEIGSLYNKKAETLLITVDDICQFDT